VIVFAACPSLATARVRSLLQAARAIAGILWLTGCDVVFGLDRLDDSTGTTDHVVARWTFEEAGGATIRDMAPGGELDLQISDESAVTWGGGLLQIQQPVLIRTPGAATKMVKRCQTSGAISIEAWITPADSSQSGPARLFSSSIGTLAANVMLGQKGAAWVVRIRTLSSDPGGDPELSSGSVISVNPARTHLVFVNEGSERRLYLDGAEVVRDGMGGIAGWDAAFPVLVANELGGDRPWRGEIHAIAVFDSALAAQDIAARYAAGP